MPDDIRKRMEALLSAHKARTAVQEEPAVKVDPEMAEFRNQFRKLCLDIVVPALNDAASLLKKHGHDCDVEAPEATETASGEKMNLYARIRIFPSGWGRTFFQKGEPPYVWIVPEEARRCVRILTRSALPDHDRPPTANEYAVQHVTKDIVEQEIFNVLQVILGGD
ncbi:MAG: hypothetical protein FJ291_23190 [Planctomycetes bacterium]|nr:hypothetical protein [Planctomycetota bacterium]